MEIAEITEELLSEIVARIRKVIDPEKIILFGSLARGEETKRSDIDILVIVESDEPRWNRSPPLYYALSNIIISKDIIVYTPSEVLEWSEVRQALVTTAIDEGRVIYEKQV